MSYRFQLVVQQDEDGTFVVRCPAIKGCNSCGSTLEEALANIKEAIQANLEYMKSIGEEAPETLMIEV